MSIFWRPMFSKDFAELMNKAISWLIVSEAAFCVFGSFLVKLPDSCILSLTQIHPQVHATEILHKVSCRVFSVLNLSLSCTLCSSNNLFKCFWVDAPSEPDDVMQFQFMLFAPFSLRLWASSLSRFSLRSMCSTTESAVSSGTSPTLKHRSLTAILFKFC